MAALLKAQTGLPKLSGKGKNRFSTRDGNNRSRVANQRGFTLIEAITVVAVLAILASSAVPSFTNWLDQYQADTEARKVFYDLIGARSRAISNAVNVVVAFDTVNNSYTITVGSNPATTMPLEDRTQFGYNAGTDIDGNAIGAAVSFAGATTVTFNSRGEASESGALYMIPKVDVGTRNDRMRAIRVVKTTGNISMYQYRSALSPPWD